MECPYCGALLPDDASFCSECGSPLAAPSSTAPVSEDPYTTPQTVSQSPAFSWRDGEAATAATVELPKTDDVPLADSQPAPSSAAPEPAADPAATRVADPLSDFGTTIEDVETEPACHADFGSTPLSEEEQLEQDRESLKTAKAEYKLARKRLGKSYAPAIAAGIIVVAALCAGTGWAGYSYGLAHPQNTEQIQKLKKQLESSKDELTKTQDELDQTKSDLKDAKAELKTASKNGGDASSDAEGSSTTGNATSSTTTTSGSTAKLNIDKPTSFANTTWRGALKETGNSWGHTCYGASKNDLVIVFKSISDSGEAVADISATLHAHDTYNAEKTVAQSDGDDYRTYTDVTGTFVRNKGFEFSLPVEEDCDLTVSGVPKKKNGKYYLNTTVESGDGAVNMGTRITDSFELLIS